MSITTATGRTTHSSGNVIARRTHALDQVTDYARTLHAANADPDASTAENHR